MNDTWTYLELFGILMALFYIIWKALINFKVKRTIKQFEKEGIDERKQPIN